MNLINKKKTKSKLRGILSLYLLIHLIFFFRTAASAQKKDKLSLDWMKISEANKQLWKIDPNKDEPGIWRVQSIFPPEKDTPANVKKKVFVIIAKQSNSYSLATNKLLGILADKKIPAELILYYFNNKKARGFAALKLAEKWPADLIFTMGSESADFIIENYKKPVIPVVTSINKDPVLLKQISSYITGSGNNIAFTSVNVPFDIQMNYIQELIPDLKNVIILYDRNHKQVFATEVHPFQEFLTGKKIRVFNLHVGSGDRAAGTELKQKMPQILAQIKSIDPKLKHTIYYVTSSTSVFSNIAIVSRYADKIPVIGSIPNVVTNGDESAVFAIGIDRRNNAHLASLYAIQILTGQKKAGELRVGIVSPPDIAINFRVARRIGLKIPFSFVESATFIYNLAGENIRSFGEDKIK